MSLDESTYGDKYNTDQLVTDPSIFLI